MEGLKIGNDIEIVSIEGQEFLLKGNLVYPAVYTVYIAESFKKTYKKIYNNFKRSKLENSIDLIAKYFQFPYFLQVNGTYEILELDSKNSVYKAYPPFVHRSKNVKNSGERILLVLNEKTTKEILLFRYYDKKSDEKLSKKEMSTIKNTIIREHKNYLLEILKNEH